jgi:uncharacterized protein YrrD
VLNQAKTLNGYKLKSIDGEIGKIEEFYFDDQYWTIRYLVVETGNWLTNKVLISPYALATVNQKERNIAINLTKKQIEGSPSLDSDKPVSRQFEETYYDYYAWPYYWDGPYMWGEYPYPYAMRNSEELPKSTLVGKKWDHHLRSTRAVTSYDIQAKDGEIGHVEDFIIDDTTWAIRYLIVDTRSWWAGKMVLVSPRWIERVSWTESTVFVNLSRATIKQSPEYKHGSPLSREYEEELHRHYNFQGYWVDEPVIKNNEMFASKLAKGVK